MEPPPEHLDCDGRTLWEDVSRASLWLAPSDLPALTLLCEMADRRAEFLSNLDASGPVLVNPSGRVVANPIVGMLSTLEKHMVDVSAALGLTPTDRARMGIAEVRATSAFEEMLAKRAQREVD
ncbi:MULTISPECIES: phage terminase small subunit P27 family [unclassified Streptomyces]|uniref:phage terminase small subunit P27 family n=1 Tax=unclassified Streptomyces TaxID=2593676 RepID=UPI00382F3619